MFNRIKEYFRKPQIGDIWYVQLSNPFIEPSRYIITDIKDGWVKVESIDAINEISKKMSDHEQPIKYLKQLYKREI